MLKITSCHLTYIFNPAENRVNHFKKILHHYLVYSTLVQTYKKLALKILQSQFQSKDTLTGLTFFSLTFLSFVKETVLRKSKENSKFWWFLADRIIFWLCSGSRHNNNLQTNLIFSPQIFTLICIWNEYPFKVKYFCNWNSGHWGCNSIPKPAFN